MKPSGTASAIKGKPLEKGWKPLFVSLLSYFFLVVVCCCCSSLSSSSPSATATTSTFVVVVVVLLLLHCLFRISPKTTAVTTTGVRGQGEAPFLPQWPGDWDQRKASCQTALREGDCWLLNVPATCECISGTDLLRQVYVLPR